MQRRLARPARRLAAQQVRVHCLCRRREFRYDVDLHTRLPQHDGAAAGHEDGRLAPGDHHPPDAAGDNQAGAGQRPRRPGPQGSSELYNVAPVRNWSRPDSAILARATSSA